MFLGLLLLGLVTRFRELIHGGNAARRAMRPFIDQLGVTHPTFLAQNGDAGYGLDNSNPWYDLHLIVDHTPELEKTVRSVARDIGFHLDVDRRPYFERFSPTSSHLIAERDGRTLTVGITRDSPEAIHAYGPTIGAYGQWVTPPVGKAILSLSLSLPSVYEKTRRSSK
jgi:hypothetical protein